MSMKIHQKQQMLLEALSGLLESSMFFRCSSLAKISFNTLSCSFLEARRYPVSSRILHLREMKRRKAIVEKAKQKAVTATAATAATTVAATAAATDAPASRAAVAEIYNLQRVYDPI